MDIDPIAVLAVLLAGAAVARSFRRARLTLKQLAVLACNHGEALESPTQSKLKLAREVGPKLDQQDNGKRDWSDMKIRAAIDAEAKSRGWM